MLQFNESALATYFGIISDSLRWQQKLFHLRGHISYSDMTFQWLANNIFSKQVYIHITWYIFVSIATYVLYLKIKIRAWKFSLEIENSQCFVFYTLFDNSKPFILCLERWNWTSCSLFYVVSFGYLFISFSWGHLLFGWLGKVI